jgi:hypothetical protein
MNRAFFGGELGICNHLLVLRYSILWRGLFSRVTEFTPSQYNSFYRKSYDENK